ncbi:carboxypeptidase-like regulatory domain-containing protein [Saccharicrinis sp. FJH62]|uniref:carboxypeptidase-like regulatory domain-containing protein n=1 Tax=Saccharicrinis sp. FJH62 TaxID=3344657 RepID=UPI0035D4665A
MNGTVLDAVTQRPVPFATVYISGTTYGTTTGLDGTFTLNNIPFSSTLIVSHASYEPKALEIEGKIPSDLVILLREKKIDLSEVKVQAENQRDKNLAMFKSYFLGSDRWGSMVTLYNDSTLLFYNVYDTVKVRLTDSVRNEIDMGRMLNTSEISEDSAFLKIPELSSFKAVAGTPLLLDMPLLGYKLQVDLVDFDLDLSSPGKKCSFLGYYFFQPYDSLRKSKVRKYRRNRRSVYYNSGLHFLRSLYERTLDENGYEIEILVYDKESGIGVKTPFEPDTCTTYISGNRMRITGLKNRKLTINYYSKINGSPVDLTKKSKNGICQRSTLYFLRDTCFINREGTVSNNDVMFGGAIATKKVGSFLPENYELEDQHFSPEPVAQKLAEFNHKTHPEKLFLATDRDIYLSGDTLWFSSWVLNSTDFTPEKLEKILYVDLIGPDGKTVSNHLFEIQNGRAFGQFVLEEAFKTGHFRLRAYTNFLRNSGPEFLFEKPVLIYSSFYKPQTDQENESVSSSGLYKQTGNVFGATDSDGVNVIPLDVQFLPEGGNWVESIPCRMAFAATCPGDRPPEFNGIIYDQSNNYITVFKPQNKGKGVFFIRPEPNTLYHAIIEDEYGNKTRFDLPVAQKQGYTLSVKDGIHSNQLKIEINRSDATQNYDFLYFTITQHHNIVQTVSFVPDEQKNTVLLNKSLLTTGIAIITLFNHRNVPLCERLVFINNNDYLHFSVDSIHSSNDSICYTVRVQDKNSKPVSGCFAVSVTGNSLLGSEQAGSTSNMVNYLLLKSELPGIDEDYSYFYKTDPVSKWITDLTMMTNGWRRFTWQEVLADSIHKPIFPLEQRFYISGKITRSGKNNPAKNIDVTMVGIGSDTIGGQTKTNIQGEFMFMVDYFTDTMDFFIQTKNRANVRWNYNISLTTNMGDAQSNRLKFMHDQLTMRSTNEPIPTIPMNKRSFKFEKNTELNALAYLSGNGTGLVDSIGQQVSSVMKERQMPDKLQPLPDTTDVVLEEISVHAERILTPMEKMRKKYGLASRTMGAEQLHMVEESNLWGTGVWSYIFKLIPDYRYLSDIGRIYIFVDGKLHYFTHRPRIPFCVPSRSPSPWLEWYIEILGELDISEIKSVEVIENPKSSPIALAMDLDPGVECEEKSGPEYIISIQTITGKELRPNHYFIGIAETNMIGFTPTRKFYTPKYTNTSGNRNRFSTVYWSPDRSTNIPGEIMIKLPKDIPLEDYKLQVSGLSDGFIPGFFSHDFKTGAYALLPDSDEFDTIPNAVKYAELGSDNKNMDVRQTDTLIKVTVVTENGQRVDFATISSLKNSFPDQAVTNGSVTLLRKNLIESDTLLISVPGWGNLFVTPDEMKGKDYRLTIPHQVFAVDSAFITSEFMNSVFLKVPWNIKLTGYDVEGVFRQLIHKENKLVRLTDFGFTHRFEGMDNVVRKFRQSVSELHQYHITDFKEEVPFSLKYDSVNIIPELNPMAAYLTFMYRTSGYEWKYAGQQYFKGRLSTIIEFEAVSRYSQSLYSGIMLIDEETKGIAHVQWHVASDKKKLAVAGYYLFPQKDPGQFSLVQDQHFATFVLKGEDWKLNCATQNLAFTYNDEGFSVVSEMVSTDFPERKIKRFKAINFRDLLKEEKNLNVINYDPSGWRNSDVLLPDVKLQDQIKQLHLQTVYKHR